MKVVLHCTDRQEQILELAAHGQSDKEIAASLGLSIHTVRTHLQRLYRTAGLSNRAEAVASWLAHQSMHAAPDGAFVAGSQLAAQEERLRRATELTAATSMPIQTLAATNQFDLVNQERAAAGLGELAWDPQLAALAEQSAVRMAENGHLRTILEDADGKGAGGPAAENVGYWSGVNDAQLHALFVADPKQRDNVLGAYRRVGAAWAVTPGGVAFLSVLFGA